MRTIFRLVAVLGFGIAGMAVECEAATFTCSSEATGETICSCKTIAVECGSMGQCAATCPP